MHTDRVKKTVYNSFSNLFISLTLTVISFISRSIFINVLGEQMLGVEGLFTNILTLLSLAELGFSSAISFCLYSPLANNDKRQIGLIMNYFKKVYSKIGIVIFCIGLLLMPFISLIVKGYTGNYNLYIIFFIYLINTSLSYFTSYNSTLLEADQKAYKITHLKFIFNFLVYGSQIIVILFTKNFILYLLMLLIFRQIERIVTYKYIKKMYMTRYIETDESISDETKNRINKNIKGILFHRVGEFAVNGTDNILISSIINISTTGLYANYLSIISIIKTLCSSIITSATSTFGNVNIKESPSTKKDVFNVLNFVSCFIIGFSIICFFFIVNDFINIWLGSSFVLNYYSVLIITINIYLACVVLPVDVVKNSTGLYYIDRYVGIIQAIINLSVSIALGLIIGLNGILIGTAVSYLCTVSWSKAFVVYKHVFESSFTEYIKNFIKNIIIILITCLISSLLFNLFVIKSMVVIIIIKILIISIIYSTIYIIFNINNSSLKYIISILKNRKSEV